MTNPVDLFAAVLEEFHNDPKWTNSLFGKIKTINNTKVGSVGERFIERLCGELSIPCSFPTNTLGKRKTQSSWDIRIANIEFELKTATEDISKNFQFNHIRYHREYQALLCLGVAPANLYFEVWSKDDVVSGKAGKLVTMEKDGHASYKLTKNAVQLHIIDDFHSVFTRFADDFHKKVP